jgi:beta-hydroxylase
VAVLAQAFAPKFLILYAFVLSAVAIHFRGRERHRFTRQLTDHSTFLAPVNVFLYLFSAVRNRPILDAKEFPETAILREHWQVFRDEALALSQSGDIKASAQYDDLGFNSFFKKGWKRFYLKWYGGYLPSARALCPRTVEVLERIPTVHGAMFAMLPPGGKLVAHRDPYAGSLRYHLGLVTPNNDKCRIYIDGEPYHWRDGEDIVFDETYIHRAINESDCHRIILFADIERPMRYRWATAANRWMGRIFVRATETKNQDGDHVGFANRLFKYVYQVRLVGKRLKKANRKLYYVVKYILFGGILVWIFV